MLQVEEPGGSLYVTALMNTFTSVHFLNDWAVSGITRVGLPLVQQNHFLSSLYSDRQEKEQETGAGWSSPTYPSTSDHPGVLKVIGAPPKDKEGQICTISNKVKLQVETMKVMDQI